MNSKNKGGASLAYSAARSYSAMVVTTEPDRHIGIALYHLEIIHSAVKCPHSTLLLPGRRAAAVKLGLFMGKSASRPRGQVSIFHVAAAGPPRRCGYAGVVHRFERSRFGRRWLAWAGASGRRGQ
jgi:hypothetical protein